MSLSTKRNELNETINRVKTTLSGEGDDIFRHAAQLIIDRTGDGPMTKLSKYGTLDYHADDKDEVDTTSEEDPLIESFDILAQVLDSDMQGKVQELARKLTTGADTAEIEKEIEQLELPMELMRLVLRLINPPKPQNPTYNKDTINRAEGDVRENMQKDPTALTTMPVTFEMDENNDFGIKRNEKPIDKIQLEMKLSQEIAEEMRHIRLDLCVGLKIGEDITEREMHIIEVLSFIKAYVEDVIENEEAIVESASAEDIECLEQGYTMMRAMILQYLELIIAVE